MTTSELTIMYENLMPEPESFEDVLLLNVRSAAAVTLPCASLPTIRSVLRMCDNHVMNDSVRSALRGMPLFEEVPEDCIDALIGESPIEDVSRGASIVQLGEMNRRMFVVLSGELGVYLKSGSQAVAALRAGETVCELSAIDHQPASATVTALEDSKLLAISEPMFWRICRSSHAFTVRLMVKLADRLRANNSTVQTKIELCAELAAAAQHDTLTGVQSRRWLDEVLPKLCEQHRAAGQALSIAVVDADHFKRINDTYGHQAGDLVLAEIGKTLRAKLRPTDFVARFGGEEFVVILPHTPVAGAHIAAERLGQAMRLSVIAARDGAVLPTVTLSIGVAELATSEDVPSFLRRADEAMYRAKNNGRDRVES